MKVYQMKHCTGRATDLGLCQCIVFQIVRFQNILSLKVKLVALLGWDPNLKRHVVLQTGI